VNSKIGHVAEVSRCNTSTAASESVVMRLAITVLALLALPLTGCTNVQPTEVERLTVCMAMDKLSSYGMGAGAGLEVATTALTSNGRTPDEAADIIDTVIRTDCPQYRQFL